MNRVLILKLFSLLFGPATFFKGRKQIKKIYLMFATIFFFQNYFQSCFIEGKRIMIPSGVLVCRRRFLVGTFACSNRVYMWVSLSLSNYEIISYDVLPAIFI